jgi:hypothetical protein
MTDREPIEVTNLDRYGDPALPWSRPHALLAAGTPRPAQVEGEAFTAPFGAPSAGPPPWHLYRFTFHTAVGVATAEPHGATRWRFAR